MANDRRRRDEHGWEEDQRGRREGGDYGSERYAGQRFGSEFEERGSDTERDWGRREEFGRGREYGRGYDRDQDFERSARSSRSYGRQRDDQGYSDYGRQSGETYGAPESGARSSRTFGRQYEDQGYPSYGRPESGEGSSRSFSRQHEDQGYPSYSRQSRGMYGQPEGGRGFEQTQGREQSRTWTDEGRLQGYGFGQSTYSGKGPKGYSRSDDRIREDVCDRLTEDPQIDASEIDVKVSSCEVTLAGSVDSREAKRRAEDCAETVSGVRNVQNNIRVQHGASGTTTSHQTKSKA
jgi:osmotically-inducible protein OsmY